MNKIKGLLFFLLAGSLLSAIAAALLFPEHLYDQALARLLSQPSPAQHVQKVATTPTATTATTATTANHHSVEVIDGMDWRLPDYVKRDQYGGLVSETQGPEDYVRTNFYIVRWDKTNPAPNQYDFSSLKKQLANKPKQSAMLRLEVYAQCETPAWALKKLRHTRKGSLIFWDPSYLETLTPYLHKVAELVRQYPQIISIQVGIADGEYRGSCDNFALKDGWGEFNMYPKELLEAEQNYGFTPDILESSTKRIIDAYAKAFKENTYKLAFNNIDPSFSWTEIATPYNARMNAIAQYVMKKGLGNRDGQVEHWMRYIHKVYGMQIKPANNATCSLDMDERFADRIAGLYWGTENEFYGDLDYVRADHGSYQNQPYRFFISSMRALQMRRTHSLIFARGMKKLDHPVYKTQDFLRYLDKTMGKQRHNTPDAFIILGERYVADYRLAAEYPERTACKQADRIAIRSFGRWVTEQSDSQPTLRINMPKQDKYWGQGFYLPQNIDYEYAARSSQQFSFKLNPALAQTRCKHSCKVQVKLTYKDQDSTSFWIMHNQLKTPSVSTQADNKIKTASFELTLTPSSTQPALLVQSQGKPLSLMMLRINFLSP